MHGGVEIGKRWPNQPDLNRSGRRPTSPHHYQPVISMISATARC
jgi:hypothetical protein